MAFRAGLLTTYLMGMLVLWDMDSSFVIHLNLNEVEASLQIFLLVLAAQHTAENLTTHRQGCSPNEGTLF